MTDSVHIVPKPVSVGEVRTAVCGEVHEVRRIGTDQDTVCARCVRVFIDMHRRTVDHLDAATAALAHVVRTSLAPGLLAADMPEPDRPWVVLDPTEAAAYESPGRWPGHNGTPWIDVLDLCEGVEVYLHVGGTT